ncbi:hypothetical protein GVAV_001599 [Gurleya vavrai]
MSGDEKKGEEEVNFTEKLLKEKDNVKIACELIEKRLKKKAEISQNKDLVKKKKSKISRAKRIIDFLDKKNPRENNKNGFLLFDRYHIPDFTGIEEFNDYSSEEEKEYIGAINDQDASVSDINKAQKIELKNLTEEEKNAYIFTSALEIVESFIFNDLDKFLLPKKGNQTKSTETDLAATEIHDKKKFENINQEMIEHFVKEFSNKYDQKNSNPEIQRQFHNLYNEEGPMFQYNNITYTFKDISICINFFIKNEISTVYANNVFLNWILKTYAWIRLQYFKIRNGGTKDLFFNFKSTILKMPSIFLESFEGIIYKFVNYRNLIFSFPNFDLDKVINKFKKNLKLSKTGSVFQTKMLYYIAKIKFLDLNQTKCLYEIYFCESNFNYWLDNFSQAVYYNKDFLYDNLLSENIKIEDKNENDLYLRKIFFNSDVLYKLIAFLQNNKIEEKFDQNLENFKYIIINKLIDDVDCLLSNRKILFTRNKKLDTNNKETPNENISEFEIKFYALVFFMELSKKGCYKINENQLNLDFNKIALIDSFNSNNFCILDIYKIAIETLNNLSDFINDIKDQKNDEKAIESTKNFVKTIERLLTIYLPVLECFVECLRPFLCESDLNDKHYNDLISKIDAKMIIIRDICDIFLKVKFNNQSKKLKK